MTGIDMKQSTSFEEIKSRIQQYLDQNDDLDLSNLSGVSLLVDAISAGIEVSKFEVLRALQEGFIQSSVLKDSVYQLMDNLQVQLITKSSCFSELTVSSDIQTRVPAYTQFKSGEIYVYNKNKFTSNSSPSNVEIKEGKVIRESLIVENNKPSLTLRYADFQVALEDITVKVDGTIWNKFDGDEYQLTSKSTTFLADVNYKGEVKVYFGTGVFGAVPPLGSSIEITYSVTKGEAGSQQIQGMKFISTDFPGVDAFGVSALMGGSNEKDAMYYKTYGSWLSASKDWASRKKDFRSIVSKFPGIIDCSVQNQADIAPNDRDWENVIQITTLTNDIWTSASWTKLTKLLAEKSSERLHFQEKSASPIKTDWGFIVRCHSNADLDSVKKNCVLAIKEYLSKKPKCLGTTVLLSDIESLIAKADPTYIRGYTRLYPNTDYENLSYYEYVTYDKIEIVTQY